jgi:hypothetical protein
MYVTTNKIANENIVSLLFFIKYIELFVIDFSNDKINKLVYYFARQY